MVLDNTEKARNLRKNQTDAERMLWHHLRNRQLPGLKFRCQVPIGPYIVDFLCHSLTIVIELDGSQHMNNMTYDDRQTQFIASKGFEIIRYWNNELLSQTSTVLESLILSQRERGLDAGEKACP